MKLLTHVGYCVHRCVRPLTPPLATVIRTAPTRRASNSDGRRCRYPPVQNAVRSPDRHRCDISRRHQLPSTAPTCDPTTALSPNLRVVAVRPPVSSFVCDPSAPSVHGRTVQSHVRICVIARPPIPLFPVRPPVGPSDRPRVFRYPALSSVTDCRSLATAHRGWWRTSTSGWPASG